MGIGGAVRACVGTQGIDRTVSGGPVQRPRDRVQRRRQDVLHQRVSVPVAGVAVRVGGW